MNGRIQGLQATDVCWNRSPRLVIKMNNMAMLQIEPAKLSSYNYTQNCRLQYNFSAKAMRNNPRSIVS
jgi:hypothetical protein